MANYVDNYITITANDAARKWVIESIGKKEKNTEQLVEAVFREHPTEYDYDWVVENCGAKWLYGQSDDEWEGSVDLIITSAWDPVDGWVRELAKRVREIDPKAIVENSFQDEVPNFAGHQYESAEYSDIEYIDAERFEEVNKLFEAEDEYAWERVHEMTLDIREQQRKIYEEEKESDEE